MQRLDEQQRWFLDAVTSSAAAENVDRHLLPSNQQSAAERLAVYQHAYSARLLEVLQNLFPCTRHAVGEELFARFATGYIRLKPPSSYTLGRLADRFADYLEATRPRDWGEFVVELVRLEQAIDRVFDSPGPEALAPFSMPDEADGSLTLRLVPGFELHSFGYPVSDYFTEWKAGRKPAWPQPEEQFIALLRRDYVVRRYDLSHEQYAVLTEIQAGTSLNEVLIAATERHNDDSAQRENDVEMLAHRFRAWFGFWAAERFFANGLAAERNGVV